MGKKSQDCDAGYDICCGPLPPKKCSEGAKGWKTNFNQQEPWETLETACRLAVESLELGVRKLWIQAFTLPPLTLNQFLTFLSLGFPNSKKGIITQCIGYFVALHD